MQTPAFEETRPADYLLRHAASDLGKAYKGLAVAELAVSPGDLVLDLGCGPGADLPALAEAAGGAGRVSGCCGTAGRPCSPSPTGTRWSSTIPTWRSPAPTPGSLPAASSATPSSDGSSPGSRRRPASRCG